MFLSEKLVLVELHKTGCTHITRLLEHTTEGKVIGKHNAPSWALIHSPRLFIGSIRNPWEWYVSLWAYGCDKRDFLTALDLAGIVLPDDKRVLVKSIDKTNTSSREHPATYYYDAETIQLVHTREKLIIDKFGYTAPDLAVG